MSQHELASDTLVALEELDYRRKFERGLSTMKS